MVCWDYKYMKMQPINLVCSCESSALPNDKATTDACISYMQLKSIPFKLDKRSNAFSISTDGLLPVSNLNGRLVTGFMSICYSLKMIKKKELNLEPCALEAKNMHHIFFFWASDSLRNLTLYLTWIEPAGKRQTLRMFNQMFPWPLSKLCFERQNKSALKYLTAVGWATEECGDILKRFDDACKHMTCMLGIGPFMFGRQKSGKIDCLVASYINVFLTRLDYFSILSPILSNYPSLTQLATSVHTP